MGCCPKLRLYPLDLGYGNKLTESGIPRLASSDKAQEILQRIQKMSDSYGTKIEIVNASSNSLVGVIRADSVR